MRVRIHMRVRTRTGARMLDTQPGERGASRKPKDNDRDGQTNNLGSPRTPRDDEREGNTNKQG